MQLAFIRYPAAAQPAVVVFVPAIAAAMVRRPWFVHAAGAAVCALAVWTQPDAIHNDAPTTTTAVLAIAPRLAPGDVLLLYATADPPKKDYLTEWMLLDFSHAPGRFPRDAARLNGPISPDLARQLAGRRAWLVMTDDIRGVDAILPGVQVLRVEPFLPSMSYSADKPAYYVEFPKNAATPPATTTTAVR